MLEPIIELDIALDRGSFALQAALQLEQTVAGTVVGLFGPSGSGKSTLLGILAGTIKPDRGRIVVNGRCLLDTARGVDVAIHQRRVGLVFQDSKLFPHLTVKRNLQYGLKLLAKADQRFGLAQIVELLELQPLLQQRPQPAFRRRETTRGTRQGIAGIARIAAAGRTAGIAG